tara:strand:+ start:131411 stop:131530 length:120 start_codon:yes stop_codon:yes gene_type:complete
LGQFRDLLRRARPVGAKLNCGQCQGSVFGQLGYRRYPGH